MEEAEPEAEPVLLGEALGAGLKAGCGLAQAPAPAPLAPLAAATAVAVVVVVGEAAELSTNIGGTPGELIGEATPCCIC